MSIVAAGSWEGGWTGPEVYFLPLLCVLVTDAAVGRPAAPCASLNAARHHAHDMLPASLWMKQDGLSFRKMGHRWRNSRAAIDQPSLPSFMDEPRARSLR